MSGYAPGVTDEWIRKLDDLNQYSTSNVREAYYLEHFACGWDETTTPLIDPPGVRTFQRFVTADIDNEGVVHIVQTPPYTMLEARITYSYCVFTGEYCDQ